METRPGEPVGYYPGEYITAAAQFLLRELDAAGTVKYSRFYDGTESTSIKLAREFGIKHPEYDSPELAIDLAVCELENEGLVEKEDSEESLPDGEPDYVIKLTSKGRSFFRDGKRHVSRGQTL